jgi:hypothetical protein
MNTWIFLGVLYIGITMMVIGYRILTGESNCDYETYAETWS